MALDPNTGNDPQGGSSGDPVQPAPRKKSKFSILIGVILIAVVAAVVFHSCGSPA